MTTNDLPQIVVAAPPPTLKRRREFSATPPKFSITHGYLWVTFAALFLAAVRAQSQQTPGLVGIAILSALSMLIGAAWSLAAILVYRWWQTVPWPCEPGHWLGAAMGFRCAIMIILSTYFPKVITNEQPICEIATSGILLLPLFSRRQPTAWKVVFGILLVLCVMPNLLLFFRLMNPLWDQVFFSTATTRRTIIPLTAILSVAVYAVWERARGVRRNWLHGLGITIWSLLWLADWGLHRNG